MSEQKSTVAVEIEEYLAKAAKRGGDRKSNEYQSGKNSTSISNGKARDQAAGPSATTPASRPKPIAGKFERVRSFKVQSIEATRRNDSGGILCD